MPVSSFSSIRERVRTAIRDTHGLLWDDAALDRIINDAQREYSIAAGSLTGTCSVTAGRSPVFLAPSDFLEPVRFLGPDGLQRPFFSWRYLREMHPDFRAVTGTELRGIVPDFDGFGRLRLYPALPVGTFAGTLFYKRLAAADRLETDNLDAVVQYCLFHVFLISDHRSAAAYYDRFVSAVNRESHVQRGLSEHRKVRRGRFY